MAKRARPSPRSVLMIGSEAQPFAKTGGLADVLGALPSAVARLGWHATVALPKYRGVHGGELVDTFTVSVGGFTRVAKFYEAPLADGARAVLVECPELYDRDALYGPNNADYPDNARRFAFLVRAAFEFAARQTIAPSIVHAHDWQAGLAPVYLQTIYADHPVLGGTPSVFTIHNLAYQGLFDADWLPRLDLDWDQLSIDRLEYWGRISLLKGGINAATLVTTVSPRYAEEIQTPELGFGFDGILRERRARPGRHPERHRHARLESGGRSVSAATVRRDRCDRKARVEDGGAGALRPAQATPPRWRVRSSAWCRG